MLTRDGDQDPEIPFREVDDKTGGVVPEQTGPSCVNAGVMLVLTVTVIVVVVAHFRIHESYSWSHAAIFYSLYFFSTEWEFHMLS